MGKKKYVETKGTLEKEPFDWVLKEKLVLGKVTVFKLHYLLQKV